MKRLLAPLTLLLLLAASPAHAQLKIRVVSSHNASQGVASKVLLLRNGTEREIGRTGPDGRATIGSLTCQPDMSFRADPLLSLAFSGDDSDWRTCSGDSVTLPLSPNTGFNSLWAAYSLEPAAFGDGSQMAGWQASLQGAETAGDVAFYANEIAYSLEQSGDGEKAKRFRSLAIAAGNASLQGMGKAAVDDPLVYDVRQREYVAKPETLDALAAFKKEQGLGGREKVWDGETFKTLKAMDKVKEGSVALPGN